jgi:NADPH:quinone reductase-like Zn-dependent oxidoreductase
MRAYILPKRTAIDDLTLTERDVPKPGPRQVLVRVRACSLNFRDLAILLGTYRAPVRENVIPLSDGAGEVAEVGQVVTRLKKGDRVTASFFPRWMGGPIRAEKVEQALGGSADGMLAEYALLDEDALLKLPDHLSFEEGATLPCAGLTAWQALTVHGRTSPGDTVLLQGTGGVSIFALQFAKLLGARTIITSSSDEKLARAKALGADETINYKKEPAWEKPALDLTGGYGVDHVVEVGGARTLEQSLRCVRIGGSVSVIGVLTGAGEINPTLILGRRASVQGMSVGSVEMFEGMNRAIARSRLKPVIDKVYPFEEAAAAFRYMESAKHFGKIVVSVG